jgi:hypothetical protein
MVSRGLRFLGAVALAAVCSSAVAWANGTSFPAAGTPKKSYAQVDAIATQGGVGSTYRGPKTIPTDIEAGCDPRIFLARDFEIEDLPDIVRLAYLKKMSQKEYVAFMQQGGNSQIIRNRDLPVILSYNEFKKLVRYEMEYRNIKVYSGRYDYLFRSSISPAMERAYLRCLRELQEPVLDVKIEPDAFEPFGANETGRRVFVHLTWYGPTPLTNVQLVPRGDLANEPRTPTGTADDDQPGPNPSFETIRPGGSADASVIFNRSPGGAKSFLAISADGIPSRIIALYQMGNTSVSFKPKQISLNPTSTELNGFMRDVRRDCLIPSADSQLLVSTAKVSTLLAPQTQAGRVSTLVLKDPQPETGRVCFEAQATAQRKGIPAEGVATLEVWELSAPGEAP